MTHTEILQELDNLQHHIMPLFIDTLAREYSDRIDMWYYYRLCGVLPTPGQYAHPRGSNYGNLQVKGTHIYPRRPIESYYMKVQPIPESSVYYV
jgi:hypothetical protein